MLFFMELKDKKIGFCLTSSFCTFKNTIKQIKKIVEIGRKSNTYNV